MAEGWSREEVEATISSYFDMLLHELRGLPYNKAEYNRLLLPLLQGRNRGAVERKHQNISATLIELEFPYISGYKPLFNYQRLLYGVVADRLESADELRAAAAQRAESDIGEPANRLQGVLDRLTDPPAVRDRGPGMYFADRPRPRTPRFVNYLQMEARNRALGKAGEQFALRFEAERLWAAGQKTLADRIEHVSATRGDGDGFDILSFEENGRERLIEVKTTTYGAYTPFYISRNELEVSEQRADEYYVYRLFGFRDDPRMFLVPGSVENRFTLEPRTFVARLK